MSREIILGNAIRDGENRVIVPVFEQVGSKLGDCIVEANREVYFRSDEEDLSLGNVDKQFRFFKMARYIPDSMRGIAGVVAAGLPDILRGL